MRLQKKLLIICLALILIPSLILTGAFLIVTGLQRRQIREQYGLSENIDPYSFSAAQRFDAMMEVMTKDVDRAQEEDPDSACRIGLLPEELRGRITAVGNAAGSGAKLLACDKSELAMSQALKEKIEFLELASLPEFSRTFAKAMNFREE